MSDLIHPDCRDPSEEFEGWLGRLIREARHHESQPVDDDELIAMLTAKADDLAEQAGGEPDRCAGGQRAALRTVLSFVETEGASAYLPDDSDVLDAADTLRAALDGEPRETVVLCDGCGWRGDPNAPVGPDSGGVPCPVCGEGELVRFVRAGGD